MTGRRAASHEPLGTAVEPSGEPATSARHEMRHDIASLFRQHARFVAWVALPILGRDEELNDIVQDVFMAAMRGLDRLRDPSAVREWLKIVTVRTARRHLYK